MIIDQLKSIVGPKGWIDDSAGLLPFVTEWRGRYQGKACLCVAPASTDEVAAVVKLCAQHTLAIVPQGGNTGLCGGAIPDASGTQLVLSLRRMNRIRDVSRENFSMVVDAGCTLVRVQEAASNAGCYFPLSLAAEGSCQIGGNLSTNAGGINVLRYGTARRQVLGLEVVLADGSVIDGLRALRKDTAGYDVKQLFIGAEGTLGIITGACLSMEPAPGEINTVMLGIDSPGTAVRLLAYLRNTLGDRLQAFELMPDRALRFVLRHIPDTRNPFDQAYPWLILVASTAAAAELEKLLLRAIEENLVLDAVIPKSKAESAALWKLRHSVSEAQKPEGASLKHDVAVPVACVGQFIELAEAAILRHIPAARIVAFGHVGDGNVHLNVSQPKNGSAAEFLAEGGAIADIIYGLVDKFGGSFSAEHGVGQARRGYLRQYRSPVELATMRSIKNALDPQGIMNPGKVL